MIVKECDPDYGECDDKEDMKRETSFQENEN